MLQPVVLTEPLDFEGLRVLKFFVNINKSAGTLHNKIQAVYSKFGVVSSDPEFDISILLNREYLCFDRHLYGLMLNYLGTGTAVPYFTGVRIRKRRLIIAIMTGLRKLNTFEFSVL
jgi:hypothetical protein